MIITIGTKNFSSKIKALDYYKDRFQGIWKKDEILSDDDKNDLKTLLCMRVDFEKDYIMNTITDFRIITNKFRAFEIQFFDSACNNWIPFSIGRCIVGKAKTEHAKMAKILRESINDQIQNYRNNFKEDQIKCQLCDETNHIQVDHISPIFSCIVEDFWNNVDGGIDCSNDNIEKFKAYHYEVANYRFLCRYHNISEYHKQGKKKTMSEEEYSEKNKERAKQRYQPKRVKE